MKKTLRLALALVLTVAVLVTGLIFANAAETVSTLTELKTAIDNNVSEIIINDTIYADSRLGGYYDKTITFKGTGKVVFNGSSDTGMHIYGGCNFVFDGPSFEVADNTSRLFVGWDETKPINITIKQGNFVGAIQAQQGTILNIEGGIFTAKEGNNNPTVLTVKSGATLNIDGATINSAEGNGIYSMGGSLNVSDTTVTASGSHAIMIASGTATFTDVTVNSTAGDFARVAAGSTLNLNNVTVNHNKATVPFDAIGTINIAGGTYTVADASKITNDNQDYNLKITAGTFNFDPTVYVNKNEYEVTENNGSWVVDIPKTALTITFDATGATNPGTATTNVQGKLSSLPTVSKRGYVFEGWFDAATGGNKITTDTVFTADTTVYAQWSEKGPWQVTDYASWNKAITEFEDGDVINITGNITDTYPDRRKIMNKMVTFTGDGVVIFENADAQTGFYFADGSEAIFNGPSFTDTQAHAGNRLMVLYSTNSNPKVTINAGEFVGEIQIQTNSKLVVNDGAFYPGSDPYNTGNDRRDIFEITSSNTFIDGTALVINGGTFETDRHDGCIIKVEGGSATVNGGTYTCEGFTRFMQYTKNATATDANTYVNDVTINHSGSNYAIQHNGYGTINLKNVTINHTGAGSLANAIGLGDGTVPSKLTVDGCNISAKEIAVKLLTADVTLTAQGTATTVSSYQTTALTNDANATINNSNLLTLVDEAAKVTVKFDAQGATNPADAKTDFDGKLATLPVVSKVGYTFNGWFDAADGGNAISTATVFKANTTVYAQWTACDHKASTAQPNCKNGATCSICGFQMPAGEHNNVWKYDANQHWQECDGCGTVAGQKVNHSGGTATCSTKAVCAEANCAQAYGEFDAANHESTEFTYVENADGTTHTKKNACCGAVAVADEAHDFGDDVICDYCEYTKGYKVTEGDAQNVEEGKDATFKIDADFSKFTNAVVKVDGTVVAAENYTAVEGSIVITLKASYLETLDAGNHTLEVTLADGGVATTTFTTAKASGGAGSQGGAGTPAPNPGTQTGDFTNITLLFVLAMLSGLAMTALTVRAKKRA